VNNSEVTAVVAVWFLNLVTDTDSSVGIRVFEIQQYAQEEE
jgi:hypothetical protein